MTELERVREQLYWMANKMKRKGEDVDELVNAVWAMGRAQKASDENLLMCIKWDIIRHHDYMSGVDRRSKEREYVKRKIANAESLDSIKEDMGDIFVSPDNHESDIDSEDFMEFALNSMDKSCKQLIYDVVILERSLTDVAKSLGLTRQKAEVVRDKALASLAIRLKEYRYDKDV